MARQELLEVYGLDLMAQAEVMLRHVREYQREVQHLRRAMLRAHANGDRPSIGAVRAQVKHLRQVCLTLSDTLDLITHPDQGGTPQPSAVDRERAGDSH
jgi:hypothetical protein